MSYVRHYGLAAGGVMWALLAKSGLISCCNIFGRLYGTDVALGSSQHERRHKCLGRLCTEAAPTPPRAPCSP